MYEIPIKYVIRGDRKAAGLYMRRGAEMMRMLEKSMSYRDLKQSVFRRFLTPDVLVECECRFGLRTVTITAARGAGGRARRMLRDCFANTTCALAAVLEVVGVKAVPPDTPESVEEPVCKTCIAAGTYPAAYHCTGEVRYTVAVCDGKGDYLLFAAKADATDFTPRCPGDLVLVAQRRTPNLPEEVLARANANPMDKAHPFTRALMAFPGECLSILPYDAAMPRIREYEAAG